MKGMKSAVRKVQGPSVKKSAAARKNITRAQFSRVGIRNERQQRRPSWMIT